MGSNGLLLAVALIERTKPCLHEGTREQINRSELSMIEQSISQALDKMCKYYYISGIMHVIGTLAGVRELIAGLLEESTYYETDLAVKNIITGKILEALGQLYMEAGKYYENKDFDYTVKLSPILNRIVDACIDGGYYFGIDEKLRRRSGYGDN